MGWSVAGVSMVVVEEPGGKRRGGGGKEYSLTVGLTVFLLKLGSGFGLERVMGDGGVTRGYKGEGGKKGKFDPCLTLV